MQALAEPQMNLFDGSATRESLPLAAAPNNAPAAPTLAIHPLANRSVICGGITLSYYLRRSNRKTIGLQVSAEGLTVSAPRWAVLADIANAVAEKAPWVTEKMQQLRQRDLAHHQQQIVWQHGVCLPYLGGRIHVHLDPQAPVEELVHEAATNETRKVLRIRLPTQASAMQIREKVQSWLMKEAQTLFIQRLNWYAPRLGVTWRKLRLSQAKTRWGSANVQGVICLNWRLIHHAPHVIDYVVVHELSHLRVMNHSQAFWDTVASIMPDYAQPRLALKKDILPPW